MPTLTPDHTPNNIAYGARQDQPAPVSPALAHQLSLAELHSEFAALKTQLADQSAEINILRSQLTARDAENASLKSAIPQADQSEISNLKSEISNLQSAPSPSNLQSTICNLQSDTPPSPDPIAAAFAPLFDNPVEHYIPGGGHTMPIIPREARTSQAGLERLKYIATRAELVLVEHVDRFAVCGIVGASGQAPYEFITRNLWRLTAVRKSLIAMEANPNAPVPDDVCPNLHATLTDCNQDPAAVVNEARNAVPLGTPISRLASTPASSNPSTPLPNQSPSPSSGNLQSTISNPQSSPVHEVNNVNTVNTVNTVNNVHPVHPVPPVPASPSIPSVPECPTYSPENLVRTLGRTAADLKIAPPSPTLGPRTSSSATTPTRANSQSSAPNAPSPTSDIEPLTSDPSHTSHSSHDSHSSHSSPHSALATPPLPDPPCPKATANSIDPAAPRLQCAECDAQLCPSRIAVPIFTAILKRTQKCDGACRFCSPKRQKTCPYTLPKYRNGP